MSLAGRPSNVGTRFHNFLYVNAGGRLRAYNTDYLAVARLLADRADSGGPHLRRPRQRGHGQGRGGGTPRRRLPGRDGGCPQRPDRGRPGRGYGYAWRPEVGASRPQLLVNATPVGMAGGPATDDLPVAPEVVDAADTVLDVVAVPALTPLVRRADAQDKLVITGAEVVTLQAVEQFVLSTGVRPGDDQIRRASEFSRA